MTGKSVWVGFLSPVPDILWCRTALHAGGSCLRQYDLSFELFDDSPDVFPASCIIHHLTPFMDHVRQVEYIRSIIDLQQGK